MLRVAWEFGSLQSSLLQLDGGEAEWLCYQVRKWRSTLNTRQSHKAGVAMIKNVSELWLYVKFVDVSQ